MHSCTMIASVYYDHFLISVILLIKESSESGRGHSTDVRSPPNCPVDRDELGQATWTFLHTMAAYYPDTPTHKEQDEMKQLIYSFSKFYPCNDCAYYMREW